MFLFSLNAAASESLLRFGVCLKTKKRKKPFKFLRSPFAYVCVRAAAIFFFDDYFIG